MLPLFSRRKEKRLENQKEEIGIFYVIVKNDWNGKSRFSTRSEALRFAESMSSKGYDCHVVKSVATTEARYAVSTTVRD